MKVRKLKHKRRGVTHLSSGEAAREFSDVKIDVDENAKIDAIYLHAKDLSCSSATPSLHP